MIFARAESGDEQVKSELFAASARLDDGACASTGGWRGESIRRTLQEAFLDFARRLPEFLADVCRFSWVRGLTGQRLIGLHVCTRRKHSAGRGFCIAAPPAVSPYRSQIS